MEEIREVLHFKNGVEHKILITYVIAKVSDNIGKILMIYVKKPAASFELIFRRPDYFHI